MPDESAYCCPNPECGNMAFEPGACSGCGSELIEETEAEHSDRMHRENDPSIITEEDLFPFDDDAYLDQRLENQDFYDEGDDR